MHWRIINIMKSKLKVASFFAGVGGIDLGFEQTGIFEVIYANEIDKYAVKTYEANFPIKVDCRDINDVRASQIPNFSVMLAGFPCQAFSLAGYRQGFNDEKGRGTLFFELVRIIKTKKPRVIFLENVKNLVGHDHGNTFRVILEHLDKLGYHVRYQVLNAKDYGNIPHGRERIYIVAFRNKSLYQKFEFPSPIKLMTKLSDCINFNEKQDDRYYYTKENCKFYDKLVEGMKKKGTIYQWRRTYVRENKSNVCPTLTANMGTGGHNVPLIRCNDGIRKLTPRETFNLQGFPSTYVLPTDVSNTMLYKQAGNSVVVTLVNRIAEQLKDIL